MESIISSMKSLTIAEQDRLIMMLLSSRHTTTTSTSEAPKPVKKGRKPKTEAPSSSEAEAEVVEKPKRAQSDGQKAWTSFVFKVRDLVRSRTEETNFPYKNSMSIASILKKAEKLDASDDLILETYKAYRLEHPPSDSEKPTA